MTGSHSPTCHEPLVRSRTHCSPTGRPSAYVTRLTSASRRGLLPKADADRAIRHLAAVGLPTHIKDVRGVTFELDSLMDLIAQDKKVKRGALTFILVRGIGQSFVARDVDAADVRAFLAEKLRS